MQFHGAFTALVTPFSDGTVDEERYRALIEWQIEQGIDGLVPCGTTGESATLSHAEHKQVVSICVDQAKGRVPVIAGAGSNNTAEAIELARHAKEAGADAALHITPYYNKPTQEGVYQHFKAITAAVAMPVIVYNVPGRTALNVLPATVARMAKDFPEVVGIKEATADLRQATDVIEACGEVGKPDFQVLSGDDFTVLPLISVGGCGVISVVSNICPDKMAAMIKAYTDGDTNRAMAIHYFLNPLSRAMFLETNPAPAKTALSMMGKVKPELRLPLVPLTDKNENTLKFALKEAGLI